VADENGNDDDGHKQLKYQRKFWMSVKLWQALHVVGHSREDKPSDSSTDGGTERSMIKGKSQMRAECCTCAANG
jgi:hypothetical protein